MARHAAEHAATLLTASDAIDRVDSRLPVLLGGLGFADRIRLAAGEPRVYRLTGEIRRAPA